jgi:hypothetical protein
MQSKICCGSVNKRDTGTSATSNTSGGATVSAIKDRRMGTEEILGSKSFRPFAFTNIKGLITAEVDDSTTFNDSCILLTLSLIIWEKEVSQRRERLSLVKNILYEVVLVLEVSYTLGPF